MLVFLTEIRSVGQKWIFSLSCQNVNKEMDSYHRLHKTLLISHQKCIDLSKMCLQTFVKSVQVRLRIHYINRELPVELMQTIFFLRMLEI